MVLSVSALICALAYYFMQRHFEGRWYLSVIKGLAVALFAVIAASMGAWIVMLALILCAFGDVALSRPGARAFLSGLISFALGHLIWIAAFAVSFGLTLEMLMMPSRLVMLVLMVIFAVGMAAILMPRAGDLRIPVAIYVSIIFLMGASALATDSLMIVLGAGLFVASDAVLGLQKFVAKPGDRIDQLGQWVIWPLYWMAILVLTTACLNS